MDVLLWLAPAGVVTVVAMMWAGWQGRRSSRELDRGEAVRRLGEAIGRSTPDHASGPTRPADRPTGVVVRRPGPGAARAEAPVPQERGATRRPARSPDSQRRSA